MKNIAISASVVTGLIGLALTLRADIYSLFMLFGVLLFIISGVLVFMFLRIQERNEKTNHEALLENKKLFGDVLKTLGVINDGFSFHHNLLLEQLNKLNNSIDQANNTLPQIPAAIQSAAQKQLEQQNSLYEIIIDDVQNTLNEFFETQLKTAEDLSDNIKRTMKSTDKTIKDLLLSLEQYAEQNTHTINNAADGYKQFEITTNKIINQMTAISKQDYDLLKDLIK